MMLSHSPPQQCEQLLVVRLVEFQQTAADICWQGVILGVHTPPCCLFKTGEGFGKPAMAQATARSCQTVVDSVQCGVLLVDILIGDASDVKCRQSDKLVHP